jgi:hypothetical protein
MWHPFRYRPGLRGPERAAAILVEVLTGFMVAGAWAAFLAAVVGVW